jgi:hypothetical protein
MLSAASEAGPDRDGRAPAIFDAVAGAQLVARSRASLNASTRWLRTSLIPVGSRVEVSILAHASSPRPADGMLQEIRPKTS